jgi:hypothetical protein
LTVAVAGKPEPSYVPPVSLTSTLGVVWAAVMITTVVPPGKTSRTRSFSSSAMNTSPAEFTATPGGKFSSAAVA